PIGIDFPCLQQTARPGRGWGGSTSVKGGFPKRFQIFGFPEYGPCLSPWSLAQGAADHEFGRSKFLEQAMATAPFLSHDTDSMGIVSDKDKSVQGQLLQGPKMGIEGSGKINGIEQQCRHGPSLLQLPANFLPQIGKALAWDHTIDPEGRMGMGEQKEGMSPLQKGLNDQLGGQEPGGHQHGIPTARPTGQLLFGQCIYLQEDVGFSGGA